MWSLHQNTLIVSLTLRRSDLGNDGGAESNMHSDLSSVKIGFDSLITFGIFLLPLASGDAQDRQQQFSSFCLLSSSSWIFGIGLPT